MNRWTLADLNKKKLDHNYTESGKKNSKTVKKIPESGKISLEKETIKKILWVFHREGTIPEYVEEHEFHHTRKFRFDWAIPSLKIAIEYEGVVSKKSRHTTLKGYTNDCTKYNIAQSLGWIILRYTALNYEDLNTDLKQLLCKNNGEN